MIGTSGHFPELERVMLQADYEERRLARMAEAETALRKRYAEISASHKPRAHRLMLAWLEAASGGPDKAELAGRLNTLDLPIWRLTPDRAHALLDSLS